MSTESAIVGIAVGVATGIASAIVAHKVHKGLDEAHRQEEIADVRHAAYNEGWVDASNNANNVRQSYTRLFGGTEETGGTTLRQGRKSA